jgi:hypothetical protein
MTRKYKTYLATVSPSARPLAGAAVSSGSASGTVTVTAPPSGWNLAAGHYETAVIPLEIIQPRPSLTVASRYYRAYPGLRYRVPIAAIGGAWPYRYELTTAPSGMTIGETYGTADYGEITWANPVTSGSPHAVTVRITDQSGAQQTVSWTITVSTSGYVFVSGTGSDSTGTGTLASPYRTLLAGRTSGADVMYLMNGSYPTSVLPDTAFNSTMPVIWMAYPDHSPAVDFSGRQIYINSSDFWFEGITMQGVGHWSSYPQRTVEIWGGVNNRAMVYRNNITNTNMFSGVGGNNPSAFFVTSETSNPLHYAFIRNTCTGLNNLNFVELYENRKTLIEFNSINNHVGSTSACYFKAGNNTSGCAEATVRANTGTGNVSALFQCDNNGSPQNMELCFNNYESLGAGSSLYPNSGIVLGTFPRSYSNFWSYRNTWRMARHVIASGITGGIATTRDVVLHNGSFTSGWENQSSATITATGIQAGTSTTGFMDSTGKLLDAYLTANGLTRGTRGHEVI